MLALTAGRTTGRIIGVYLLLSAVSLAFEGRPAIWPFLLGVHLLGALILLWEPLGRALRRAVGSVAEPVWCIFRAWAPMMLVPLFYKEVPLLNRAVHGGHYFDPVLLRWEEALFGGQPSRMWAEAFPALWASEILHGAYLSYFAIIATPPLVLYLMRRREAFQGAVLVLTLVTSVLYLVFVYFPVQGPRYLFPPPTAGDIESGPLYQLTHRILQTNSSQGAAFPSGHVAVSTAQTVVCARFLPRLFPLLAVLTLLLAISTVYGGFHYLLDALLGAALGAAGALTGLSLLRRTYTPLPPPPAARD